MNYQKIIKLPTYHSNSYLVLICLNWKFFFQDLKIISNKSLVIKYTNTIFLINIYIYIIHYSNFLLLAVLLLISDGFIFALWNNCKCVLLIYYRFYCLHIIARILFFGLFMWLFFKYVDTARFVLEYSTSMLQTVPMFNGFFL